MQQFIRVSISSTFYARLFCTKGFSAAFLYLHVSRKKLSEVLSYKKCASKMLMKLAKEILVLYSSVISSNVFLFTNSSVFQSSFFSYESSINQFDHFVKKHPENVFPSFFFCRIYFSWAKKASSKSFFRRE